MPFNFGSESELGQWLVRLEARMYSALGREVRDGGGSMCEGWEAGPRWTCEARLLALVRGRGW